jgi:hypothetical protein
MLVAGFLRTGNLASEEDDMTKSVLTASKTQGSQNKTNKS